MYCNYYKCETLTTRNTLSSTMICILSLLNVVSRVIDTPILILWIITKGENRNLDLFLFRFVEKFAWWYQRCAELFTFETNSEMCTYRYSNDSSPWKVPFVTVVNLLLLRSLAKWEKLSIERKFDQLILKCSLVYLHDAFSLLSRVSSTPLPVLLKNNF